MVDTDYTPNPAQTSSQAPVQAEPVKFEMQSGPLSLDQAAGKLSALSAPARAPSGQFAPKEPAAVIDIATAKPVEAKKPEGKEMVDHNGGPEMEEDEFFEWAPEKEGDAPRRVKVDEVLAAYEELPKLKTKLEEIEKNPTSPAIIEAVSAAANRAQEYLNGLEAVHRMIRPVRPDPNKYADDPEGYRQAMAGFENQINYIRNIEAEHQKVSAEHAEKQKVLVRAKAIEASSEIVKFWPEMKEDKSSMAEFDAIEKTLGISRRQLMDIPDANVWRVVKYAMEYTKSQAKQAEAVKVVRAKPKLVRGAARQPTNTKAEQAASAMQRLAQSGSVDDAAAALSRLFG